MRLLYRPAAIEDIERAADYIEHQLKNPSAAEKLKTTIVKKAALLKDNPEMGMPVVFGHHFLCFFLCDLMI